MWGNKTLTPIERPANLGGRAFLTDEEIAAINQQRVVDEQARDDAPARRYEAGQNVGGYGSCWLDAGDTVLSTGQTSMIVDPPDGRARASGSGRSTPNSTAWTTTATTTCT